MTDLAKEPEVVQFTCNVYKVLEADIDVFGCAPCKYYAASSAEEIVTYYRTGFATSTWPKHEISEFMANLKVVNLTLVEMLSTVLRDDDGEPYRLVHAWTNAIFRDESPQYLGMKLVVLQ